MRHICSLLLVLASIPQAAASPKTAADAQCKKRAQAVGAALRKLATPRRAELLRGKRRLVPLKGARWVTGYYPVFRIQGDGGGKEIALFENQEVAMIEADWGQRVPPRLAKLWARRLAMLHATNPDKKKFDKAVAVLVEPKTSWHALAGLLRIFSSVGIPRAGVLVAVKDPGPPMPPSRATRDIKAFVRELERGIDPRAAGKALITKTKLQERFEAHWKRATKHCPQIEAALKAGAGANGDDKTLVVADGVKEALVACACRADLPSVHARVHLMLHHAPQGVVWFKHDAKGPRIARPAKERWSQTVARWLRRHPKKQVRGNLVAKP